MSLCQAVAKYLKDEGATNDEVDDFLDFIGYFKDSEKKGRYEVYRLWARLLRHRRTPFKKHDHFDFDPSIKDYLRFVSKGEIVDADVPSDAVKVSSTDFIKFVIRHLNESF